MSNETETPQRTGIHDMGMLDLRSAKTAEDLAHITEIHDVGAILIPEHLATILAGIPMHDVGTIVPIPQGDNVNCMVGEVRLTAEALAAGSEDAILVVAGQAFITGDITTIGYRELRIVGQLFAPRSSQQILSGKITQLTGQNFFLPDNPRVLKGETTVSLEFLELLPQPVPFVVMGILRFEDDVTKEAVKAKITEIVLMGKIEAPKALLPLLEVITAEKMGEIVEKQ